MKKLILFLSLLLSLNTQAATAPVLLGGNTNDQVLFVFFLSNGITNADRIIAGLNTNGTLKFNTNLIAYGFLPVGQTNWIFTGATNSAWLASIGLTNGQYVAATNAAWLASLGLTNTPFTAATNWGNTLHLDLNATGHSITNANIVKATSFIGDGSGLTGISGGGGGLTSNSFQTNFTAVGADNHDAVTISSTSSNNAITLTAVDNRIVALPPSDPNADGNNIIFRASDSGVTGNNGGGIVFYSGHSATGNSGSIAFGDTNIAEMIVSPSDQTVNINSQLYVDEIDLGGTATLLFQDGTGSTSSGDIWWGIGGDFHAANDAFNTDTSGNVSVYTLTVNTSEVIDSAQNANFVGIQGTTLDLDGSETTLTGENAQIRNEEGSTQPLWTLNAYHTNSTPVQLWNYFPSGGGMVGLADLTTNGHFHANGYVATNTLSAFSPNGTQVYLHFANPSAGNSVITATTTP